MLKLFLMIESLRFGRCGKKSKGNLNHIWIIDDLRWISQYNNGISKIINLLDNTPNQPSKFKTKNIGQNKWWFTRNIKHQC